MSVEIYLLSVPFARHRAIVTRPNPRDLSATSPELREPGTKRHENLGMAGANLASYGLSQRSNPR
jgi:hypothetical protein